MYYNILELESAVVKYYLGKVGICRHCNECGHGSGWLDMMASFRLLARYLETKDREELQISLNYWNRLRASDNILSMEVETTCEDFRIRLVPLCALERKKFVYMDFGVYQLYESNESFRSRLDDYIKMDEIQFVYGPTHMEEICRMNNSAFEIKRRENISKVCGDYEVLPLDKGCLKIVIEPVDVCFARAKKYQDLNQRAEESECAMFEALNERTCKLLGWGEKEAEKYRKEFSMLTLTQLFDPNDSTIANNSVNKVFGAICFSPFPVEEFRDYCKEERTFPELREAVRLLYILISALVYCNT